MAQKLSDFLKTASRTSYVKSSVKQAVSKMGMTVSKQVSERQAKEVLGELKKSEEARMRDALILFIT